MMIFSQIKNIYNLQSIKFPIISSVFEQISPGEIYCNNNEFPTHCFIVHQFGFCQEFYSEKDPVFFEKIKFLIQTAQKKLRLYNPDSETQNYLAGLKNARQAKRIHMTLADTPASLPDIYIYISKDLPENLFNLNLSSRYYKNMNDFFRYGHPLISKMHDTVTGIVYAAGNSSDGLEIDIFVDEQYRKQKLGEALVKNFIAKNKTTPIHWDCYANLESSLNLAKKLNVLTYNEYLFYNINKG